MIPFELRSLFVSKHNGVYIHFHLPKDSGWGHMDPMVSFSDSCLMVSEIEGFTLLAAGWSVSGEFLYLSASCSAFDKFWSTKSVLSLFSVTSQDEEHLLDTVPGWLPLTPSMQLTCHWLGLLGAHPVHPPLPYLLSKPGRVVPRNVEILNVCLTDHLGGLELSCLVHLWELQALKSKHLEGSFYFIPAQHFCKRAGPLPWGRLLLVHDTGLTQGQLRSANGSCHDGCWPHLKYRLQNSSANIKGSEY